MTKKHFQLIADTIDTMINDGILSPHDAVLVATRFEMALATTNDNFKAGTFYDAATKSLPRVEKDFEEACA